MHLYGITEALGFKLSGHYNCSLSVDISFIFVIQKPLVTIAFRRKFYRYKQSLRCFFVPVKVSSYHTSP